MYDSFLDVDDKELFLCRITTSVNNNGDLAWFGSEDIPSELLKSFKLSKFIDDSNLQTNEEYCNTDKSRVNTCDFKTRTCGIQIICTNCGLFVGCKELHGSESCTQVAEMLLDFKKDFVGNLIFYYKTYCQLN